MAGTPEQEPLSHEEQTKRIILMGALLISLALGVFSLSQTVTTPPMPDELVDHINSAHVHTAVAAPRSGKWHKVQQDHLAKEPACAICGATKDLEVHHIEPFHVDQSKELDPDNLITLCQKHHFQIGHLWNFQRWNPHVREDAALLKSRIEEADQLRKK